MKLKTKKITFEKAMISAGFGRYECKTDDVILQYIIKQSEVFNYTIKKIRKKESFLEEKFIIKLKIAEEDFLKFIYRLTSDFGKWIENITF